MNSLSMPPIKTKASHARLGRLANGWQVGSLKFTPTLHFGPTAFHGFCDFTHVVVIQCRLRDECLGQRLDQAAGKLGSDVEAEPAGLAADRETVVPSRHPKTLAAEWTTKGYFNAVTYFKSVESTANQRGRSRSQTCQSTASQIDHS